MTKLKAYSLLLTALVVSGCIARLTPYEVDRVDQELSGNRGVVEGDVSDVPEVEKKKTRRMYDLEIELPSQSDKEAKRKDTSLNGNRGYLIQKQVSEKSVAHVKKERQKSFAKVAKRQVIYKSSDNKYAKQKGSGTISMTVEEEPDYRIYIVEKGDTLQKISVKAYGTTKKWKKIFEANRNVLESPDKIKPGQELIIPKL